MEAERVLQQAMTAARAGQKAEAQSLLKQLVNQEPKNARAWYLLSQVVEQPEQQIYCLKKVLEIDPDNQHASLRLEQLQRKTSLPARETHEHKRRTAWPYIAGLAGLAIICIAVTVLGIYIYTEIQTPPAEISGAIQTEPETTRPAAITLPPSWTPTVTPTWTATATLRPTFTPLPTNTPIPTATPTPVRPTAAPEHYSGIGSDVLDVHWSSPGALHIVGNAASRNFIIKSFGRNGEYLDLLVNVVDPYSGIRPVNLKNYSDSGDVARLQIEATGSWEITYYPLNHPFVHALSVPGEFSGSGDDVILLSGKRPDLGIIDGASKGNFIVIAYRYTKYLDLLVNEIGSYSGTVIVPAEADILVVEATGPWTIKVTGR